MTTVKRPVTVQRNCKISNCTLNLHRRHKHHLILLKGNSFYEPSLVLAVKRSPDRFHPKKPLSSSELHPLPWYFSSCDHQGVHIFKKDKNSKRCSLPHHHQRIDILVPPFFLFLLKGLYKTFLFHVQAAANEPYWHTKSERLKENVKFRKVEDILAWTSALNFWGLVITSWEVWTMNTHMHASRPLENCFLRIQWLCKQKSRERKEIRDQKSLQMCFRKVEIGRGYFKNKALEKKNKYQMASITGIQPSTSLKMTCAQLIWDFHHTVWDRNLKETCIFLGGNSFYK